MLYAASALVLLIAAHTPLTRIPSVNPAALDGIVLAGGILVSLVWLFPWHRYDRNFFLAPFSGALILIALAVYFSGGWSSPLSVLFLLTVAFAAGYFSLGVAILCIGLALAANLSPQLYAPDTARFVEHLVLEAPAYLAIAFACRYVAGERARSESRLHSAKLRELQNSLQREMPLDDLTGLPARARFETTLRQEVERVRRLNGSFVLVFLDLDDFKRINDIHGHRVGDEALKLAAQVFLANARRIDVVTRYGGDEFVALLPSTSLQDTHHFFERIRQELAERSVAALGFPITLSAGAAQCTYYACDPESLLDAADQAMYRAKRHGKDRLSTALSLADPASGESS